MNHKATQTKQCRFILTTVFIPQWYYIQSHLVVIIKEMLWRGCAFLFYTENIIEHDKKGKSQKGNLPSGFRGGFLWLQFGFEEKFQGKKPGVYISSSEFDVPA